MKNEKGFTLIELMVIVAIVGIISAIAIPLYQSYVAKSQVTVAIAELQGAKSQYELIVSSASASDSSGFTVANMFFSGTQSHICIYSVNAPDNSGDAQKALACELQNVNPMIAGQFVYLSRNTQGNWQCSTSSGIRAGYKPAGCI